MWFHQIRLPVHQLKSCESSGMDGGGRMSAVSSLSASFGKNDLHTFVVYIMVYGTSRITAAAYTCHQIIGIVATDLFLQLLLDFLRYDTLQAGHHVRIRVGTYRGTDDVEGIGRVTAPVAYRFVGGVFQCHITGCDGAHFSTEHLHPFHIRVLSLHIQCSLIHHTRPIHQCTDRGCGHTVLTGTGLGDDTGLAHFVGKKDLSDGVVDLVGTRMIEVLTFEIQTATVFLTHAFGIIKR